MNDADSAAAVAAVAAVRHSVVWLRNARQVRTAALIGNSQIAAASELSV